MMVCKRCGKENQDHYKFCLGCGAELRDAGGGREDAQGVGMMKTVMADSQTSIPQPSAASSHRVQKPGNGSVTNAPRPAGRASGGPPLAAGLHAAQPAPQPIPAGPPPGVSAAALNPQSGGADRACTQCGATVPVNFRFCGACGFDLSVAPAPAAVPKVAPTPTPQAAPQAKPQPRAGLTLIRPDGSEGGQHTLEPGENQLGRNHGVIFENDGYLSPEHATLTVSKSSAVIRDCGSLNGVFVRMIAEEEIQPGQVIRIGQELLRFDKIEGPAPLEDGTEVMGSPNPGYWGKITVIIGKDTDGSAYPLMGDQVNLGRERGDINFPDDGYVSGLHARLTYRGGRVYLSDVGSSNGTFLRVREERTLENGAFVLLGQQLFRLKLS